MSEQQNIDVVKKGYEAFGRGDIPGLLAQLDANVSWVAFGPADLPTAGNRRGHQGVTEFFQQLAAIVDKLRNLNPNLKRVTFLGSAQNADFLQPTIIQLGVDFVPMIPSEFAFLIGFGIPTNEAAEFAAGLEREETLGSQL